MSLKTVVIIFMVFLWGCSPESPKQSISIPILDECKGQAIKTKEFLKKHIGIDSKIVEFYSRPSSHDELYGYLEIFADPSDPKIAKRISIEVNTIAAYCYSDTEYYFRSEDLERKVSSFIEKVYPGDYKNPIYIKWNESGLHLFISKKDGLRNK
ncbi:hypothetical protein [Amphritea pacifica]|uniref:Lipoprotein n=1 Tax=Amphritea pacifica TaxID=2811233 RepID=A0ABS2WDX3_9GAMM|nr:hypothetical protein [Amphritea pacifica]MBN0989894.1 hypothetical protein [Amphritea pacifica]